MPGDIVQELTGGAPAQSPAIQGASAGAPESGLLAGSPQAPPEQQAQQAAPPPRRIPLDMAPEGIIEALTQENGRRPTPSEVASVRAAAMLSQQLGRRPSRRELFTFLYGRSETPPTPKPQFALDA